MQENIQVLQSLKNKKGNSEQKQQLPAKAVTVVVADVVHKQKKNHSKKSEIMDYEVLNKKRNIFYQIFFFIGVILMIWEISIFRKTVISISLLLIIIGGIGSLATFFDFKNYSKTYSLQGWKLHFFAFIQNTISWGFIVCSMLVLSNYYFSKSEINTERYEIIETASMPGSKGNRSERKPLVRINYHGEVKELVFSNQYYQEIDDYKYVNIITKKGFLHWDIIVNQELEK